jgi:hypothetical protein
VSTAGHLLTTTGLPPSMDSTFYPTAALSYGWVQVAKSLCSPCRHVLELITIFFITSTVQTNWMNCDTTGYVALATTTWNLEKKRGRWKISDRSQFFVYMLLHLFYLVCD